MDGALKLALVLSANDGMSRPVMDAARTVSSFAEKMRNLAAASQNWKIVGDSLAQTGRSIMGTALDVTGAYANQEDAAARLKMTMLKSGGVVSESFEMMKAKAVGLGNALPGTTADFNNLAASMLALGVDEQTMLNGGLDAAAKLGTALSKSGVTYEQAGVATAKLKEAMGVTGQDLVKFMDQIQRAAFSGVGLEDMQYAFGKLGGTLKQFGMTGLQSAEELSPLMAMLIKNKVSGEEAGTALSQMLNQSMDIKKVSAANHELARYGINLQFMNKQGKSMGLLNIVQQMDKLNKIKNQGYKTSIISKLFGTGTEARIAGLFSAGGMKAYQDMAKTMKDQAGLEDKASVATETLSAKWDALKGSWENFKASLGGGLATTLKPLLDFLNNVVGKLQGWAEKHPGLSKVIMVTVAAVGGLLFVVGGLFATLGTAGMFFSKMYEGFSLVREGAAKMLGYLRNLPASLSGVWATVKSGFSSVASTFSSVGSSMGGAVSSLSGIFSGGFSGIITAVKGAGAAFMASPIGWIAAAIAVAALLIYKYWEPIKAFFEGVFEGIKSAFAPIWDAFKPIVDALTPVWGIIKKLWDALVGLFQPAEYSKDQLSGIAEAGKVVGKVLGGALYICFLPLKLVIEGIQWLWNALKSVGEWISANWKSIVDVFLWLNPVTGFFMLLQKLFKWLFGVDLFAAGKKILGSLWDGIKAVGESIWAVIKAVFEPLIQIHVWIYSTLYNVGKAILEPVWNGIKAVAGVLWDVIAGVFSVIWEIIYTYYYVLFGIVKRVFSAVWQAIKAVAGPVWETIKAVFTTAWNVIRGFFPTVYNLGKSIITKVVDGFQAVFGKPIEWIRNMLSLVWDALSGAARKALEAGKKIVDSIAQGIKNGVNAVVDGVKGVCATIRSYLPFSPAKTGPLSTIHKVRIFETVAESIRPEPLVTAMNKTLVKAEAQIREPWWVKMARMKVNLPAVNVPKMAVPAAKPAGGAMPAKAGRNMTINYAPKVVMPGGPGNEKNAFLQMLRKHKDEVRKIMQEADNTDGRLGY